MIITTKNQQNKEELKILISKFNIKRKNHQLLPNYLENFRLLNLKNVRNNKKAHTIMQKKHNSALDSDEPVSNILGLNLKNVNNNKKPLTMRERKSTALDYDGSVHNILSANMNSINVQSDRFTLPSLKIDLSDDEEIDSNVIPETIQDNGVQQTSEKHLNSHKIIPNYLNLAGLSKAKYKQQTTSDCSKSDYGLKNNHQISRFKISCSSTQKCSSARSPISKDITPKNLVKNHTKNSLDGYLIFQPLDFKGVSINSKRYLTDLQSISKNSEENSMNSKRFSEDLNIQNRSNSLLQSAKKEALKTSKEEKFDLSFREQVILNNKHILSSDYTSSFKKFKTCLKDNNSSLVSIYNIKNS